MDSLTRNQQTELGKQIVETRHQCDLIESKHELQTQHFNDLKIEVQSILILRNKNYKKIKTPLNHI